MLYDSDAYRNQLHRLLVSLVTSLPLILVLVALSIATYGFYASVKSSIGNFTATGRLEDTVSRSRGDQ